MRGLTFAASCALAACVSCAPLYDGVDPSTGAHVRQGVDLGTRTTFADLGQTLAELFGVGPLAHGTSFLHEIVS